MLPIITLFLITSFTNVLATLKTILISKKIMNPVYMVVFVDAMIFATVLTKVTSADGLQYTLAYALGRTFGVFIGGKLDDKLALGIVEVDILLKNKDKLIAASDAIRHAGYTVNNYLTRGINGDRRYNVEVVLKRKEMSELENILKDCDINNPTLKIKPVSKVAGKITTSKLA
ncbi:hypothetical protein EZV73_00125 [Acidaminobacter sp. JC074]|uniref:DUF5698 domain-containing protein n=1 Tax=Acidaminobacter sp. JC074 TaxID=2530199 RepID=UPI001F10FDCE|nr:DUF5698 domain-containing protein [Acidaminobacter sp. JC074]MCH4885944.1 hypothetical protein [Acidaminobacter sp. JC074]